MKLITEKKSGSNPSFLSHRDNGAKCTSCHATDQLNPDKLKPIWSNYPVWPGYYGSEEDSINPETRSLLQTSYAEHRRREEIRNLKTFIDKQSQMGPYSALQFNRKNPMGPYSDIVGGDFSKRPNARLQILAVDQNIKRIMDKIMNSPDYDKYKSLLAAMLFSRKSPRIRNDINDFKYCNLPKDKVDNPKKYSDEIILQKVLQVFGLEEDDFSLAHFEDRTSKSGVKQVIRTFEDSNIPYSTSNPFKKKLMAELEETRKKDWDSAKEELEEHGEKSKGLDYWNGGEISGNIALVYLLEELEKKDPELANKYVKKYDYNKLIPRAKECGMTVDENTWVLTNDFNKRTRKCVSGIAIESELTAILEMNKSAPFLTSLQKGINKYQSMELALCEHLAKSIPKDAITSLFPEDSLELNDEEVTLEFPQVLPKNEKCETLPGSSESHEIPIQVKVSLEEFGVINEKMQKNLFKEKCLGCHIVGTGKDLAKEKYAGKISDAIKENRMPPGKMTLNQSEKENLLLYISSHYK